MPHKRSEVHIRPGRSDDAPALARMTAALEREAGSGFPGMSVEAVRRDVFGPEACVEALVAEADGTRIGCALLTDAYDVAFGMRGMRLELLYVAPSHRDAGVGRALMGAACNRTRRKGGRLVLWEVASRNRQALGFYQRLGARQMDSLLFAIWGAPMHTLADEAVGRLRAADQAPPEHRRA